MNNWTCASCFFLLGGTNWWIVLLRPTTSILNHHFDMDRGFGHWIHWVSKKCWAWTRKEALPRWPIWSIELGQRPWEEGHTSIGRDQACTSRHGWLPRFRCPSSGHWKGPTEQLGYTFEWSTSHHYPWHIRLLLLNIVFGRSLYIYRVRVVIYLDLVKTVTCDKLSGTIYCFFLSFRMDQDTN